MQLPKSLQQNLLHELLALSVKLDDFKEVLFLKYLQFPLERNESLRVEAVRRANAGARSKYSKWNSCLQHVQANTKRSFRDWYGSGDSGIIPKYLEAICQKHNGSLDVYKEHFERPYLKEIEHRVQVFLTDKGLLGLPNDFAPEEFEEIMEQVIITFKETNQEQFKVSEPVHLSLEIKNVPELTIKVFQFNTETYYKKNLKPFPNDIDLQGMVPSIQRTEKGIFKGVPKNKIITHEFKFDELKDKVGLFIIEFEGNGKMSRAVIKKGSLSFIHRPTAAGHAGFIIDDERNVCKSEKTGVWFENKLYKCDLQQNGSIFIPYGSATRNSNIVLIHNDFAQMSSFSRATEKYDFLAHFHVNSEQFLAGQEAHILVRPSLSIQKQKLSPDLLKNCKVKLVFTDYISGMEMTKDFENLSFSEAEEAIVSFRVPPSLKSLEVTMSAEVELSSGELSPLSASRTFSVAHRADQSTRISELYLRRVNKEYFLYVLGRNGEPQTNGQVRVGISHVAHGHASEELKLNK